MNPGNDRGGCQRGHSDEQPHATQSHNGGTRALQENEDEAGHPDEPSTATPRFGFAECCLLYRHRPFLLSVEGVTSDLALRS